MRGDAPSHSVAILRDLLATIHRDGAQHAERVGLDRAMQDAIDVVTKYRCDIELMNFPNRVSSAWCKRLTGECDV